MECTRVLPKPRSLKRSPGFEHFLDSSRALGEPDGSSLFGLATLAPGGRGYGFSFFYGGDAWSAAGCRRSPRFSSTRPLGIGSSAGLGICFFGCWIFWVDGVLCRGRGFIPRGTVVGICLFTFRYPRSWIALWIGGFGKGIGDWGS